MSFRHLFLPTVLLVLSALFTGCGQSGSSAADEGDDTESLLGEILGNVDLTEGGPPDEPSLPEPIVSEVSSGGTETAPRLELRLSTGDQFPLIKTVEQTLVQKSEQFPANAQTRLQLHMTIQVDEVRPEGILLNIRYTRIAYSHDVNGQRVAYDSDSHQGAVPTDLLPYAGMVGNGFSFWLGQDNKIRELVGYQEFLQRCVEQIPGERREYLLAEIASRFGDDGVAGFVDDTIGLLPYDSTVDAASATRVTEGDEWVIEKPLMRNAAAAMTSTCRLLKLNEQTAEIDISGRITPGEARRDQADGSSAVVTVTGGRCTGLCIVDRRTGLPLEVSRSRYLNMVVTTPTGQTVEQDKQIKTTIQTFPNRRGSVAQLPPESRQASPAVPGTLGSLSEGSSPRSTPAAIRNVSGLQGQGTATPIPTTGLSSTATAVYPD